jgi:hypothetical protein
VDPVQDDKVESGEQLAQAHQVSGPIGQVEVAEHGDLVHRPALGGGLRRGGDRLGVSAGTGRLNRDSGLPGTPPPGRAR